MLKIKTKVRTKTNTISQVPNNDTKKLWQYILQFFKSNHAQPTTIVFEEDGKFCTQKATRTNISRALKKSDVIQVHNTRDIQINKRSLEIHVCACEDQFACKCGG